MKLNYKSFYYLVVFGFLNVSNFLYALDYRWDSNLATSGVQDGDGVWVQNSTNFWNGSANVNPPNTGGGANRIIFGANNTDVTNAGVVTVNGALVYADASSNTNILFDRNYILSGTGSLAAGNVNVSNGATATIGIALSDGESPGNKTWAVGTNATLNLSGGGNIQNLGGSSGGKINFTDGTWTAPGVTWGGSSQGLQINLTGGTFTSSNNFNIGTNQNNALSRTDIAISNTSGGSTTFTPLGDTTIGSSSGTGGVASAIGTATLSLGVGSVFNAAGTKVMVGGGGNTPGNARYGSNAQLNISGGTYTQNTAGNSKIFLGMNESSLGATHSTVNISGGLVKTAGFQFGDNSQARIFEAGSTATINLSGGTVYLGNGGISINGSQNASLTRSINLSGGTLGAIEAWSSAADLTITLSNANGGVRIRAANDIGVNGQARTITLDSKIDGSGTLTKTGSGQLIIQGASNTYSGGTIVERGTLISRGAGNFGTGNVTILGGASLIIENGNSISDLATLFIDITSALDLDNVLSQEVVAAIVVTSSGNPNVYVEGGRSYTASQLSSLYGLDVLGNGSIFVAIPEPSVFALSGLLPLAFLRRKRS